MNKKSIIKKAVKHNGMGGPGYVNQPINNPTAVPNTNTGPSLQNQGLTSGVGNAIPMPPVGQNLGNMIAKSIPRLQIPQQDQLQPKQRMQKALRNLPPQSTGLPPAQLSGQPSAGSRPSNTLSNPISTANSPLNGNVGAQQAQQHNTQMGQNMQNAFNATYKPTQ